jgi:pimeloyl-ACP methyl ester carboxylesterase
MFTAMANVRFVVKCKERNGHKHMAFCNIDGKNIYYEVHGQGKPIILLNGIFMSTLSWHVYIKSLTANNQLILMDFFDQLQSDKLDGQEYDHSIQVAAIKGLMDHLGLEKASLAGLSYGGNVAMKFALAHPDRVDRLAIYHAAAKTGHWLQELGTSWILNIDDAESFYYTVIPVIYHHEFYDNNTAWAKARREFLINRLFVNRGYMEGLVRLTNSNADHDIVDRLGEIKAKTLIVASDNDHVIPMAEQRRLAAGIPNAELLVIPDCGHASMYEKPALFASTLLGFVNTDFDGLTVDAFLPASAGS